MRLFLIIGGLFFIYLFATGIFQTKKELEIYKNGILVEMKITEILGTCIGTKSKNHMKVAYEGNTYLKKIPSDYCKDHFIGEWVVLKYKKGSDLILLPQENPYFELFSSIAFGILGLVIVIWFGLLKKSVHRYNIKEKS